MREVIARTVVEFLSDVFLKEGFPEFLVTEIVTQFVSSEVEKYLHTCGITHLKSSLFHPQTNGLVERMNRVLGECIRWALSKKCVVSNSVRSMLWFYRTTPYSTTGVLPFELLRGRRASTTVCPAWMSKWIKGTQLSDESVGWQVKLTQDKQKLYFDSKKSVKEVEIGSGDFVRIKKPVHVKKGFPKFSPPIRVTDVRGNSVKLINGQWWNKSLLVKNSAFNDSPRCETDERNVDCAGKPALRLRSRCDMNLDCEGQPALRRSTRDRSIPRRYRD